MHTYLLAHLPFEPFRDIKKKAVMAWIGSFPYGAAHVSMLI